jgi:hypothetical protein
MPIINGQDTKGRFYKYGEHGHKYYYITNNTRSRQMAKSQALKQSRAINYSRYKKY